MSMVDVIIVAAGSGTRLGHKTPKAFVPLKGKPIVWYSLRTFQFLANVRNIVLVVPPGMEDDARRLVRKSRFTKVADIVRGGTERKDSVINGLSCLSGSTCPVLIHDAARPLADKALVGRVIAALDRNPVVVPVLAVSDTIKCVDPDSHIVKRTLERESLRAVQTPQGFSPEVIPYLIRRIKTTNKAYDEAMLLEKKYQVNVVDGDPRNFKITVAADLVLAGYLL
jgi:2-C-methyl-D-erythritol 4-phosphate cytidylyltransferase